MTSTSPRLEIRITPLADSSVPLILSELSDSITMAFRVLRFSVVPLTLTSAAEFRLTPFGAESPLLTYRLPTEYSVRSRPAKTVFVTFATGRRRRVRSDRSVTSPVAPKPLICWTSRSPHTWIRTEPLVLDIRTTFRPGAVSPLESTSLKTTSPDAF